MHGALLLILRISSIVSVSPERYPLQRNSCSRSLLSHNRTNALTVTYGPVSAALAVVASSSTVAMIASRFMVYPVSSRKLLSIVGTLKQNPGVRNVLHALIN